MSTIIAKIDHFTNTGLPMLRLVDGTLIAGDADVRNIDADVGDVVIWGDGWEKGSQADWEPRTEVGLAEHVAGTSVFVRTALGLTERTIPEGLQVKPGNTVTFDARRDLLGIATTKSLRPSLFGDDFDVASVRSAPNPNLDWTAFAGFPSIRREAQEIVAVHTELTARKKLRELGVAPVRGILFEGPPGTGKTFLAQIMAAQSRATFYLVTTALLGGRLVSESEQRLEAIYADAAEQEMSIMFIDEIEVLTKDRGSEQEHGSRFQSGNIRWVWPRRFATWNLFARRSWNGIVDGRWFRRISGDHAVSYL